MRSVKSRKTVVVCLLFSSFFVFVFEKVIKKRLKRLLHVVRELLNDSLLIG